jgi:hypothetical protein
MFETKKVPNCYRKTHVSQGDGVWPVSHGQWTL